jgi:hypothetical protein
MATPQLSPGVLVREVDLTVGRADNVLDNIGAIAGPFAIGPVDEAIDITTENELINVFGKPLSTDGQYEYWMTASSFLSYGGVLKVVRTDGSSLNNANAGVGFAYTTSLKIKNYDDYQSNYSDDVANYIFASKNPGSWANNLKVCVIDDKADQTIGISTTNLATAGITVGYGVTVALNNLVVPGAGSTGNFNGYLKGIITGVSTDSTNGNSSFDVKVTSRVSVAGSETSVVYSQSDRGSSFAVNDTLRFTVMTSGVVQSATISGVGTNYLTGDTLTGGPGTGLQVSVASTTTFGAISAITIIDGGSGYSNGTISLTGGSGSGAEITAVVANVAAASTTTTRNANTVVDWYDQQQLGLTNGSLFWKSIAPKPGTSGYASERNGKSDEIHIAIIDDLGTVTGIQGNLLEKHIGLSKASDAVSAVNSPQKNWWKDYLAIFSNYVYVGDNPSVGYDSYNGTNPTAVGYSTSFLPYTESAGQWNVPAQGITFSAIGNVTYTLGGGVDYSAAGGMTAALGDLIDSYNLFSNKDEIAVDYLIMGPGLGNKYESQAKANYLISIAGQRKDCVATISPHRADVVNITNTDTQTDNIIEFFGPLSSSSYAVFDSGYKYTYDRFNNQFRYIPCNGDVAGLMVRTSIVAYPWFSPAGQQRGILNNAIKLAYNPNKAQRDQLYPVRVNSIVNQPGIGILLFGDKTALGYASAFDRINVRRLFLTVEQSLERSAQAQLFELNDQITRSNFVNIVEPYLRDIQAKRGIYDFLVVCDETNNTPDVIDNNEFRADIFLKPAKSINYVTLTFVATRTGVSFDEVAGRV